MDLESRETVYNSFYYTRQNKKRKGAIAHFFIKIIYAIWPCIATTYKQGAKNGASKTGHQPGRRSQMLKLHCFSSSLGYLLKMFGILMHAYVNFSKI